MFFFLFLLFVKFLPSVSMTEMEELLPPPPAGRGAGIAVKTGTSPGRNRLFLQSSPLQAPIRGWYGLLARSFEGLRVDIHPIQQLLRSKGRFREILGVFFRYGLADWLTTLPGGLLLEYFPGMDPNKIRELSTAERIRMALTELGTTYIKLGQILSTRPDLVGPEIAGELAKLQSTTPADPPQVVREILEAELGASPEALYVRFDPVATASASIGQIHRAQLHDGTSVVVKVQHRGIEDRIRQDVEMALLLAETAERYSPPLRGYHPVATTREFTRTLLAELDFGRELQNLLRFHQRFRHDRGIRIPTPYPALSSRRILTMDRLEGVDLAHVEDLRGAGYDLDEFARRGARLFLDMIFRDGFYHADPHPGNLLILPDGRLGLLDCGMVGRIDPRLREHIEDMLIAIAEEDSAQVCDLVVRLGALPAGFDAEALRNDIDLFIGEYGYQSLEQFDLTGALNDLISIIRRHKILLPSRLALLFKVLIMLEGTARKLSPRFSLAELVQPYQADIVQRRLAPQRMFRYVRHLSQDWLRLAEQSPKDLSGILEKLRTGRFDVRIDHRRLDSIMNRLVKAILAAALFLGSTELLSSRIPPLAFGVSVPGMVGCGLALFLGIRVLWAILRSGKTTSDDGL